MVRNNLDCRVEKVGQTPFLPFARTFQDCAWLFQAPPHGSELRHVACHGHMIL